MCNSIWQVLYELGCVTFMNHNEKRARQKYWPSNMIKVTNQTIPLVVRTSFFSYLHVNCRIYSSSLMSLMKIYS